MTGAKTITVAVVAWWCSCVGCAPRPLVNDLRRTAAHRVIVSTRSLGQVPNSGLLLPVVSPDGKRIAGLQNPLPEPIDIHGLVSGRGLEQSALWLRSTQPGAPVRMITPAGAAWPTWSPDGTQLVFVGYDHQHRCTLAVYEPATGRTRRLSIGPAHLIMPAVSPSGRRVAVAAYDQVLHRARVLVVDLHTLESQRIPLTAADAAQLWPLWIDGNTLAYVRFADRAASLIVWSFDASSARYVTKIAGPIDSAYDTAQLQSGIARPVAPSGKALAVYDIRNDRIVLIDLVTGDRQPLAHQSRAGCWVGGDVFAAATDERVELALLGEETTVRLLDGPHLPRWASHRGDQLILLGRGDRAESFQLLGLHSKTRLP